MIERRRRSVIWRHRKTEPVLEIFPAKELFPSMGVHDDHYIFGYRDQIIGSIQRVHSGGLNSGQWGWSITVEPYDLSMTGSAETHEEAAAALATRFRKWIEDNGVLKEIPRYSSAYRLYISQRLNENGRRQPNEWRR